MRNKLLDIGSEVIQSVVTLSRLDRVLILDIDPSVTEGKLSEALKATVPEKFKDTTCINGLWRTSLGYAKALASAP